MTFSQAATTNYFVRGVLKEVKQDERQLVIAHEEIPNFMEAMTMPDRCALRSSAGNASSARAYQRRARTT